MPLFSSKEGEPVNDVLVSKLCNSLPAYIRSALSVTVFKSSLKTFLFSLAFNSLSLWHGSVGCPVFHVFVCSAHWSAVLTVSKCAK